MNRQTLYSTERAQTMRVRGMTCWDCGAVGLRDLRRRLCQPCYSRRHHAGELPEVTLDLLLDRLVFEADGCWEWCGSITSGGYGGMKGKYLHRITYAYFVSEIPDGLQLDHLCRNRSCCNPWHTEPVTHRENGCRSTRLITECPHKHPYTAENTYISPTDGHRMCRACMRARQRIRDARKRKTVA